MTGRTLAQWDFIVGGATQCNAAEIQRTKLLEFYRLSCRTCLGHSVKLLMPMCTGTKEPMHFWNRKKGTDVQFTEAVMQMTKQQCFCGGKLAVNSPVKRRRVTLCLTAENHLPVLLHGVYWKHNAAWLLREHGALQHVAYRQTEREREGEKESDQHAPLTDTHPACKTSY